MFLVFIKRYGCLHIILEIAKEKGGTEYTSVNKTLAFLASQIGIEED